MLALWKARGDISIVSFLFDTSRLKTKQIFGHLPPALPLPSGPSQKGVNRAGVSMPA